MLAPHKLLQLSKSLLLGLLFLAACTPLPASLANKIDQAEQQWLAQGIVNYRLQVEKVNDILHLQTHEITVRNGAVVEQAATCAPAPAELGHCEVRPFEPTAYTIPGLFTEARRAAQIEAGARPNPEKTRVEVEFDPVYGFPSRITYRTPEISHGYSHWKVTSFEMLE